MTPVIQQNVSLRAFNTLALPSTAEYFCSVSEHSQLLQALEFARTSALVVTIIGGGSNIVLAGDIPGLVIQIDLRGVSHRYVTAAGNATGDLANAVDVTFAAGENWHQQVLFCLDQGWYGLENLSLIPGTMGAAPIQNIGAYGVELADRLISLQALDRQSGELVCFDRQSCEFGYRDSLFKHAGYDRYIIVDVTLRLSTKPEPNISYPALSAAVEAFCRREGLTSEAITPRLVSNLVCEIRRQKLPDPALLPNAGSFFKNPLLKQPQLNALLAQFEDMPNYPQPDGGAKIPAAWLIEQCGLKGAERGEVGVHDRQALVLINRGQANGAELLALAGEVRQSVEQRFAISLEIEPRIYGVN